MQLKMKHKQMYMRIAEAVAQTSSSVRLKVGAVAVKNNQVIGTGYNALPTGLHGPLEDKVYNIDASQWLSPQEIQQRYLVDDVGLYELVTKKEVRHAEKNLILSLAKSTESTVGASVFCTHSCCYYCALDLADIGITHFYYKEPYRCDEGLQYLVSQGIMVEQLTYN